MKESRNRGLAVWGALLALAAVALGPSTAWGQQNTAPSVSIGSPSQTVAGGTVVILDATATDTDVDDTLTYDWTAGPNVGSFANAAAVDTTWTAPASTFRTQSVTLTLTVTDQGGLSGDASVVIDVAEAGFLGQVVIRVAQDGAGDDYGYSTGSYGTLVSGDWPGDLFTDGNARTVAMTAEDGDGDWRWEYSGGEANGWLTGQDALDAITVTATYADGRDTRTFVLGGFIADRPGDRSLTLDPPLPSRDWDGKNTQEVTIEFRRRRGQDTALTLPAAVTEPPAAEDSWAWLLNQTPGGPVGTQLLLTVAISMGLVWKARNAQDVLAGAAALVLIPGVMAAVDVGDWLMTSITAVSIVCGALMHQVVVAGGK